MRQRRGCVCAGETEALNIHPGLWCAERQSHQRHGKLSGRPGATSRPWAQAWQRQVAARASRPVQSEEGRLSEPFTLLCSGRGRSGPREAGLRGRHPRPGRWIARSPACSRALREPFLIGVQTRSLAASWVARRPGGSPPRTLSGGLCSWGFHRRSWGRTGKVSLGGSVGTRFPDPVFRSIWKLGGDGGGRIQYLQKCRNSFFCRIPLFLLLLPKMVTVQVIYCVAPSPIIHTSAARTAIGISPLLRRLCRTPVSEVRGWWFGGAVSARESRPRKAVRHIGICPPNAFLEKAWEAQHPDVPRPEDQSSAVNLRPWLSTGPRSRVQDVQTREPSGREKSRRSTSAYDGAGHQAATCHAWTAREEGGLRRSPGSRCGLCAFGVFR